MSEHDAPAPIPVAAVPEVGSERLAAALAAQDVPAIGQALRHDVVVVPIVRGPDGETQNRVFEPPAGSTRPYELCLFSSARTLAAFLRGAPDREFALRRGDTLAPFLERHADVLERVVFDPAGPHPMAASVADVSALLVPQPGDDELAWVTGPDPEPARPEDRLRSVGFDLRLPEQWAVIELDDADARARQVRELVRRQTRVLGDRGARLRQDLRAWLESAGERAVSAGGRLQAFLLEHDDRAALALSLTVYWHELGPELGGSPHLERIENRIRAGLAEGDAVVGAETTAGPLLRHVRERRGAPEVGGEGHAVLLVDYWLASPDRRGAVQLAFSTPHVAARAAVLRLTDNVVLATGWAVEPRPGAAPDA
jgi:hypothetical protein